MPEEIYTVKTSDEQIQVFCQFAEKYKSDFDFPPCKKYQDMPLTDVYKAVLKKYTLEEGEQIIRPLIYEQLGKRAGDCDDATIFWISLLRSVGFTQNEILICEAKEDDTGEYCHIFTGLKLRDGILWIDNLPGTKLGVLDYPRHRVRVTRMSDYL